MSRIFARWRRKGKGIWYITLIIEGDDQVYSRVYPGTLNKSYAAALSRRELSREEQTPLRFVIVTDIQLKDLP